MMNNIARFDFRKDSVLTLDLAGNTFEIDVMNVDLINRLNNFSQVAIEKGNEISKREDYTQGVIEVCNICGDAIDEVLGVGSYEKIFAGREVNVVDHIDLINFISAEITKFRNKRFQAYAPNRAERRKKK